MSDFELHAETLLNIRVWQLVRHTAALRRLLFRKRYLRHFEFSRFVKLERIWTSCRNFIDHKSGMTHCGILRLLFKRVTKIAQKNYWTPRKFRYSDIYSFEHTNFTRENSNTLIVRGLKIIILRAKIKTLWYLELWKPNITHEMLAKVLGSLNFRAFSALAWFLVKISLK